MEKSEEEHVIWSNRGLEFSDWEAGLKEQYPDRSPEELTQLMYELNGEYLEDERCNLNIQLHGPILVIADLGLWDGRKSGYREIQSGNIRDCLYSNNEESTWYVDRHGDLRCRDYHHDGTNHYLYREWRDGVSDARRTQLKDKIYLGTATDADIIRATKRIGDKVCRVYGWKIPPLKKSKEAER